MSITREFEEKFAIKLPKELEHISTFDEYLKIDNEILLKPFENYLPGEKNQNMDKFAEITEWLYAKINNLSRKIDSTKEVCESITLEKMMEEENFNQEILNKEEYSNLLKTYKMLTELPLKEKIEDYFHIKLENFSIRQQAQFINFISSAKESEIEKVKKFIGESASFNAETNRIKTFLSLEADKEMGAKILEIAKSLPEYEADKLFNAYARLADNAEETADNISRLYDGMFFEKHLNKKEIISGILEKGRSILLEIHEKIGKNGAVVEIISKLNDQEIILAQSLKIFESMANELNSLYYELDFSSSFEGDFGGSAEDFKRYEEEWIKSQPPQEQKSLQKQSSKNKRFDSERIKNLIAFYTEQVNSSNETIKEEYSRTQESPQKIYEPMVEKLKKLLPYQLAFEKKLDKLIFGRESTRLPEKFSAEIKEEILNYNPELDKAVREKLALRYL